jgi:hypothetical protein
MEHPFSDFFVLGQAIFELITTEGAYVRDLQLIVEVCEHYL